jgi:signal transduction histidine kinase/CheY-like chemotaxis protein/HPt (histidine-containing phosphotransfer) domain-containing protein
MMSMLRWMVVIWMSLAAIGGGCLVWLGMMLGGWGVALGILALGGLVLLALACLPHAEPPDLDPELSIDPEPATPTESPHEPTPPSSPELAPELPESLPALPFPTGQSRSAASGKSAADLQQARDEAHRANEAKSFFLATMSHEIRTPLAGLIGLAEGLTRTPLNELQRKHVATLTRTAEGMLRLINDILDLSKVESGAIELEVLPFSLTALAEESIAVVAPIAERKGLPLRLELGERLTPNVRGDSGRLRQVLLNLLSNAVRFTDRGEVVLRIETDPVGIRFTVRDTGIGIAPDALGRIFQPFVQADRSTSRTHGGTGLGLAISSKLVECMGGRLLAQSTSGEGSTFSFILPLLPAALLPMPASAQGDETVTQRLGRSLHVLVVEDNLVNQQVLTMLLERLGCTWEVAENGQEGVMRVAEKRFDVILMDLQMPGIDGFRATRLIRAAQQDGPRVPIVACTANAMEGERERCLAAGMDDYLTKPVRGRQLLECFARLFGVSGRAYTPKPLQRPLTWRQRLQGMGFDEEAILRLAHSFCESVPSRLQILRHAFDENDYPQVRLMAHTLKSSLTIFGADLAAQAAAQLEMRAAANDLTDSAESLLRVESDTRSLLEEVGRAVESLA